LPVGSPPDAKTTTKSRQPFCGSFALSSVNRQKATRFSVGPCEQLPAMRHEYIQFESGDRILVCQLTGVVHREAGFKRAACESKAGLSPTRSTLRQRKRPRAVDQ